jgi:uncharacterized protein YndB with AHSA1/START domain
VASVRPYEFDRSWRFAVPRAELWDLFAGTDQYRRWWTWLREFDSPALEPGAVARCVIGPPLPYALHLRIALTAVEPGTTLTADVDGDLAGPARLDVAEDGEASTARLSWSLEPRRPLLRRASRVARPVLEWGHNWVVATGVEQFRSRALSR